MSCLTPEKSLVALGLGEALDGRHEDVVVAEETGEDELREGVSEARLLRGVENDELHGDVEPLPNRCRLLDSQVSVSYFESLSRTQTKIR